MRLRLYGGMLLVTLINVLLASVFLSALFYGIMDARVKSEIRNKAQVWAAVLRYAGDDACINALPADAGEWRVTLMDSDGKVLFDTAADIGQMDNHLNRPEVFQAAEDGFGESTRYSDTLRGRNIYYATRLFDGRFLRVSKNTGDVSGVLVKAAPVAALIMLAVLAFNFWLSARLTRRIIAPINHIDLDDPEAKIYDELTVFIRTIQHQRALIENQVRSLEKRAGTIDSIIDHMREGFLMLSNTGAVVAANKSALRIFGATEDCVGKDAVHFSRDMDFLDTLKQALHGRAADMIIERERSYRAFLNPVNDNGVIVLFVDITDSRQAEQMRRTFTANVSHELKTPLTSISGYAEVILAGLASPADTVHFAGKIRDEAARLSALVNDILFLSRLDETEEKRAFEAVDVTALAAEAADARREAAEAASVSLVLTGEPVTVKADRLLLYEMLLNLIDNGIKYNVPQGTVTVVVTAQNNGVLIAVSDTGVGIPAEHLSRVFERFYRVDPSRSRKTGGTGLGLSIVKHIAQYHEGLVEIESVVNEGTAVRVKLPEHA